MVLTKNRVHLSNEVLNQIIDTENSCVEVIKQARDIRTLPYHGNKISNAVKEQLNELIGRYVENLNGIVLGYKHIKVLCEFASTDPNVDSACSYLPIEADFYLFRPVAGKVLQAVVTKKSKDHVGCLVYHTFNASISKPEGDIHWEGKNIEIGQEIVFRVTSVKLDCRIPHIRGEFLNKSLKGKKIKFDDHDETLDEVITENPIEENNEPARKKRKSRKSLETEMNNVATGGEYDLQTEKLSQQNVQENLEDELPRKKKKKSRRSLENEVNLNDEDHRDASILCTDKKSANEETESEMPVRRKKKSRRSYENDNDDAEIREDEPKPKKKRKD